MPRPSSPRLRSTFLSAAVLGLVLGTPPPAGAELSPDEERIAAHVAAGREEGLALLERSVNLNSGTLNFAGVEEVGELFAAEFERLGFTTRWVEGEAFERAGHLVAERSGDGPGVLLIGHLDTVFEPDSPFQRYEAVGPDRARGPGITDMKGGVVVMLLALDALREAGSLDRLDLRVVLTGDEEKSGDPLPLARAALLEAAEGARVALGFEDGDGRPETAVVARRGSSGWLLRSRGTPAHSSQVFQPEVGAGAIFEAARVLGAFREALADEEILTFNPGLVLGGTTVELAPDQSRGTAFGKTNVVAGETVVAGDLRAISPEQLERAWEAMRRAAAASLPGTSSELVFDDGYPPMAASEGNLRLLGAYDRASQDLGLGPVAPVDPRNAGAADISFVASAVEMALDGLGLMGTGGHTLEETADLRTLVTQAQRAAVLLHRLAGGELDEE